MESHVSRVTASKKRANDENINDQKEHTLIERVCKVLDSSILEYLPSDEPVYRQNLYAVFQDVNDQTVLKLTLDKDDFLKLGIELGSKDMIDMCSWLKSYNSNFKIIIPIDSNEITLDMLFTAKLPEINNQVKQLEKSEKTKEQKNTEINLTNKESKAFTTRKFGRKK